MLVIFLNEDHRMIEKHISKIEFIFILLFLIFPPIISQLKIPRTSTVYTNYSVRTFILALVALIIYWHHRNVHLIRFQCKWTLFNTIFLSGKSFICFGSLCLFSIFFEALGYFFIKDSGISQIILPNTINLWINFFTGTICAAFYEEVIYRMYLPESMKHFIVSYPKIPKILPEIIAVLLFSLGHIYLGIFGFLNAFFCGIILRWTILKTHSIWFSLIPHTIYNFCVYLIMAKLF